MPLSQKYIYTSEDYWNLPEGRRAELIDGQIYDIAPPGFKHQKIISQFSYRLNDYIRQNGGDCEVIPAPFAVNLDADDKNWVITEITGKKRRYAPVKRAYRDTAKRFVFIQILINTKRFYVCRQ
ncbi:MAG TPA: Uma2 family endonuclease [Candidatus Lachnoclostridium pullistercoris]|uniref:Uma2 family endonuclease n=1 Tax=Candidatus Lachnoclostridium pullistercoris TaxID=2838632 RepID=A0A9D2T6X5_9FIRM|nr:Uma2 family endonuclease [Candidatus Lachnoclostridium pullistercoris]